MQSCNIQIVLAGSTRVSKTSRLQSISYYFLVEVQKRKSRLKKILETEWILALLMIRCLSSRPVSFHLSWKCPDLDIWRNKLWSEIFQQIFQRMETCKWSYYWLFYQYYVLWKVLCSGTYSSISYKFWIEVPRRFLVTTLKYFASILFKLTVFVRKILTVEL